MTTSWCPQCGSEYRAGVATCADCGVDLVDSRPAVEEPQVGEVVVYELADWDVDQRGALEQRLQASAVVHQWELPDGDDVEPGYEPGQPWEAGTDLVVGERDEELIDGLLEEIESPDALAAVDDDGDDDEATYEVMSRLYVAADRLKDDPDDLALAGGFFDAADAAAGIDAPFGIDAAVWRRVQGLAAEAAAAIEDGSDDDAVATLARRLRDILFGYV